MQGKLTPMENCLKCIVKGECSSDLEIAEEFFWFWGLYDDVFETNHFELVVKLYKEAYSLTDVAYANHIEDRTLYGYRVKYIKAFFKIIQKHNYVLKK